MIVSLTLEQTEETVFTVPSNKTAYIYLDLFSPNNSNVIIKINDITYYQTTTLTSWSAKLILTSGDQIKISTNGTVNVFIHGLVL